MEISDLLRQHFSSDEALLGQFYLAMKGLSRAHAQCDAAFFAVWVSDPAYSAGCKGRKYCMDHFMDVYRDFGTRLGISLERQEEIIKFVYEHETQL